MEKSRQIASVPLIFTNDYIVIIKSNPDFYLFVILGIKNERADLNHRPLDLQSNALPLTYTSDFLLQELRNTQIIYIYYSSC